MTGKIALVTRADGGLGTHVAKALLDARATIVGLSKDVTRAAIPVYGRGL
jgi:NAD(P)-dependent dehydrogenase (short-subunit alcohol dehydrogenase family)